MWHASWTYFVQKHQEDDFTNEADMSESSRKWECTKRITPQMVFDAVDRVESFTKKVKVKQENFISLGINLGHDASAALCVNGELITNIAQERISRIKHDKNYPFNAIEFVLNFAKIKLTNVDKIVFTFTS